MEFFRKHHRMVIWFMIVTFLLTLIPSVIFFIPGR